MEYVCGFSIVCVMSLIGEVLHDFIPIPIPAGIYGMVLLLLSFKIKIIKVENVRRVGSFFIQHISMLFIPATVGIFYCLDELMTMLLPILISVIIVTPLIMGVSGRLVQKMIERKDNNGADN